jgi:hypothetical protein
MSPAVAAELILLDINDIVRRENPRNVPVREKIRQSLLMQLQVALFSS